jgi:hypothetical protein
MKHLCVLFYALALFAPAIKAAEPLARCYLIYWDTDFRAAPSPQVVRLRADFRCTIQSPAQFARLKTILQLERLRNSPPDTRDLRFVVDFRRTDGSSESYYADRFFLMSADMARSRRVGDGFRREIDSFVRSCLPRPSR